MAPKALECGQLAPAFPLPQGAEFRDRKPKRITPPNHPRPSQNCVRKAAASPRTPKGNSMISMSPFSKATPRKSRLVVRHPGQICPNLLRSTCRKTIEGKWMQGISSYNEPSIFFLSSIRAFRSVSTEPRPPTTIPAPLAPLVMSRESMVTSAAISSTRPLLFPETTTLVPGLSVPVRVSCGI